MKPIPLMRAAGLKPFVRFLRRVGTRVERLLARANLPPHVLDDGERLIPAGQAFRFMEDSARTEGIANLGLLVGQETPIDTLGVFGRLIRCQPTVDDAIHTALIMTPHFISGEQSWMDLEGDRALLCQRFGDGLGEHAQADQFGLMVTLNMLRLGAGPDWQPAEVYLQAGRPAGSKDLEPLAGCPLRFGQPVTAVAFPRELLGKPLPSANGRPGLGDVEPRELEAWRASGPANDFPGSLLQVADALCASGYPQIASAADAMGMSVRSLQRRLSEAGVTYKLLVTGARFAAATELLETRDAKILDIALDLGYSDHAHFTRAFRRWTGTAPRDFRRAVRAIPRDPTTDPALTTRRSA